MSDVFFNFLGGLGVFIILSTYLFLQISILSAESLTYSIMNFIGSFLIIISLFHDWNLPSFVIEASWCLISLYGIIKSISK